MKTDTRHTLRYAFYEHIERLFLHSHRIFDLELALWALKLDYTKKNKALANYNDFKVDQMNEICRRVTMNLNSRSLSDFVVSRESLLSRVTS